jgi:signal transduction histidine kinase
VLPDPQAGEPGLDPELETTVYRLVQESLTNIAKHANATTARVAIRSRNGAMTIEVEDDGVGFDASQPTSGFGLSGMRERVYLAAGTLQIESPAEGEGTVIRARLPRQLRAQEEARSAANQVAS